MCDLCNLPRLTPWYYEDEYCVICDCKTCGVPMVVLRRHSMEPVARELASIAEHVMLLYGPDVRLRLAQRQIADHMHWHILL